jgi:hypothetical protein
MVQFTYKASEQVQYSKKLKKVPSNSRKLKRHATKKNTEIMILSPLNRCNDLLGT